VRAVSVDELAGELGFPDVLFVDVEGHELEALRGSSETLAGRPDLFVEVHAGRRLQDAGGSAEELMALVAAAGYDDLLVSGPDARFLPWCAGAPLPRGHFFLVAQAPEPGPPA
jgi:hypothetical protein